MSHIIPHGWRTRLHFLSRSHRHLGITCAIILVIGYVTACLIASVNSETSNGDDDASALHHYFAKGMREIATSDQPPNRALAEWLNDLCTDIPETAGTLGTQPPTIDGFIASGTLFGQAVAQAIKQYAGPPPQQSLCHDYVLASLDAKDPRGQEARARIESAALQSPPAPLANEFLGHLLEDDQLRPKALQAFQREGQMPDALYARECALDLAIDLKDLEILRELMATEAYRRAASGHQLVEAGSLLSDPTLQLSGAIRGVWERIKLDVVLLGLLAALLWYAVFVRFSDRQPWRWSRLMPAVIAGIASVGPTILLAHYQDKVMGLSEEGGFPNDLIYYVAGVGLREELCKLALFALFLPWLLRKRDPLTALLTGACVGLGFALEENLGYYQHHGFAVATGRLLTANFMHAAMTALPSLALYEMVRTRFAKAEAFIGTFVMVVLVHGIYDWAFTAHQSLPMIGDISLVSMLMLALLAHQLFHQLEIMVRPSASVISLLSIFVVGSSLVVSLSLVLMACETPSFKAVNEVASGVAGYVPIVILYLRRIGNL